MAILVAAPARSGNWLDCDQPIGNGVLQDVIANGYQGIWRYVPLPNNSALLDISAGELERICAAGIQCALIQHPRLPQYNDLTRHDPEEDARSAVARAIQVGYPEGSHLGLDFEGLKGTRDVPITSNTPDVCENWATSWQAYIRAAGFMALLYVGYDVPLDAQQLYELPGFDQYWSDAGHRSVATRGVSITQGGSVTIHGIQFDRDVLRPDLLGAVPWVAQMQAQPAAS
jgi:hypothetical protein